ncbi:MAG: HEAT repeat domain-containing protein, partial [Candidatus Acidiferrum sp.]
MSGAWKLTSCADVAPLLVFYVCDEVDARERAQIEAHLSACPACATQLREEESLHKVLMESSHIADHFDPSGVLLAQCRSELAEKLDDLNAPPVREHWHPFGWMRQWMALRPVLSGGALVLFGLVLGTQSPQWFSSNDHAVSSDQAMNVRPTPRLTPDQLSKMAVAGINFSPSLGSAPGTVQVQLSAEQPMTFSGTLDDPDVRHFLTFVVENNGRTDAGVRLDCLEALKAHVQDPDVRHALVQAARKDQNPAVRLKALESLRDLAGEESVRDALVDALEHDTNPGVRVEAVNLLVRSLENEPAGNQRDVSAPQPGS